MACIISVQRDIDFPIVKGQVKRVRRSHLRIPRIQCLSSTITIPNQICCSKSTSETKKMKEKPDKILPIIRTISPEKKEAIISTIQDMSGEITISRLMRMHNIKRYYTSCICLIVEELLKANKILIDRQGIICWIFNPNVTAYYTSRPDLRIR